MGTAESGEEDTDSGAFNSTESPPFEFSDYRQRVVVATLYLAVIVLGTLGNTLVLLAVALSRRLRTATNAFVANLAAADLLTCLVLTWDVVVTLTEDGPPVGGEWGCRVVAVAQSITIGCSAYSLAAIGLQRLLFITQCSAYRTLYSRRKIAAWLAVAWLVPLSVTVVPPALDVGGVGYNRKYHHCGFYSSHPRSNAYDVIVATGMYPVPLATIVVCYALIWRHIRRHVRTGGLQRATAERVVPLRTVSASAGDAGAAERRTAGTPSRHAAHSQSAVARRQAHITRNMAYIVAAFFLCLTPFAVCLFYDDSDPFLPYASVILVFNSCVNPLIYATKHRDFKAVFRCILRRDWRNVPQPSRFLMSRL